MSASPDSVNPANREAGEKVTIVNLDAWLYALTEIVAKQKEDLDKKDKLIKDFSDRIAKLENNGGGGTSSSQTLTSSLFNNMSTEAEIQIFAKVRREFNKAKKIERNVIVSELPAAVGDTEEAKTTFEKADVAALMTTLGSSIDGKKIEFSVDEIRRVKTNNDKLSLIVVDLGHEKSRDLALRGSKNLKGNDKYNQVFINKDMTKAESRRETAQRGEEKTERGAAAEESWRFISR
jgi:hypothetical protein